jgi:hypothetical protein
MTAPVQSIQIATAKSAGDMRSRRVEVLALVALAIFERVACWHQRPPDMPIFLEPWFAHIVHYGPIQAFAHPFSNYEPAYLYLLAIGSLAHGLAAPMTIIKILSVLGTVFLYSAIAGLLRAMKRDTRGALLVLVLPSVAINDGLLAQCDALWAGACIFALAATIRGRTLAALVWCGVAISFKAQAAFMAPVIIGAMIGRRPPLWQWCVPGVIFVATLAPAWLLGWPASQLLTVYLDQASLDQLAGRLANPWMFGTIFAEHAARHFFVLGYAAAGLAALGIAALAARNPRNGKLLILLGALAGTALPFLLPKMLERYYFLGDVMTLALALSWKSRPSAIAVRAVQIASILTHFGYIYFFYDPWPTLVGVLFAAAALVAMGILAAPAFRSLMDDVGIALRWRAVPAGPVQAPERRFS